MSSTTTWSSTTTRTRSTTKRPARRPPRATTRSWTTTSLTMTTDTGPTPPDPAPARRPPRSRLTADVLESGRRAGAREGLDWLGRAPEAKASLLYRLVRLFARLVIFGVFRFRIDRSGQEHLPAGGGYLL